MNRLTPFHVGDEIQRNGYPNRWTRAIVLGGRAVPKEIVPRKEGSKNNENGELIALPADSLALVEEGYWLPYK